MVILMQIMLVVCIAKKNILSPKNIQKNCQTFDRSMPQKSRLRQVQKGKYEEHSLMFRSKD